MKAPLRIAIVFGTRPEAIKLLPVIAALRAHASFSVRIVVTGQHREMLDATLRPFGVNPDVDLDIMQPGQSLNEIVSRVMPRLDALLTAENPDVVLVQGDTTSAFCAALAAFHRRIAVGHIEAGLRSDDRFHPYPEEVNRRMISACADLHFAPTARAAERLSREGTPAGSILVTGNTAIDALMMALELNAADGQAATSDEGDLVLVTLHRREAWAQAVPSGGTVIDQLLRGIRSAAEQHPRVSFVYPVHLNPRVREPVWAALGNLPNVRLIEPLAYLPFVALMRRARVIITDSGGVQEEGPSLGVPVLVLRRTTERPEAMATGSNRLVGTEADEIQAALAAALATPRTIPARFPCPSPYGDGKAAARIRDGLLAFAGLGPPAEPLLPERV